MLLYVHDDGAITVVNICIPYETRTDRVGQRNISGKLHPITFRFCDFRLGAACYSRYMYVVVTLLIDWAGYSRQLLQTTSFSAT